MTHTRLMRRLAAAISFLPLLIAWHGCSPPLAQIKGKVMFDGELIRSGTVKFVGSDGKEVSAPISPDGDYQITGIALGEAKISVVSRPAIPAGFRNFSGPPAPGPAAPSALPEKTADIPSEYGDPNKSGLTYNVESGANWHSIELERIRADVPRRP
jgi:hypothetical protein